MSGKKESVLPKRNKKWTRDDTELTLLGIPTFIWYICFSYLPMFGIIIAFKEFRLKPKTGFLGSLLQSKFVWFKNFKFFVTSNDFLLLLRNTILYNIVFIILGILIPVVLAIMISLIHSRLKSKVYQTMMFMPHFMSWVVVSYFVFAFLSQDKGFLNNILTMFGKEKINWYSEPQYWPFIFIFMQQWKSIGYSMVVYLACITGIDSSLYEAAVIDGATKWQQTRYITLPSLKTVIIMMFILKVGGIFYSDFGLFYQVTQQIPASLHDVASTFDTYVYNALQSNVPIGKTAAASVAQSVACCITILTANFVVKKINKEQAII